MGFMNRGARWFWIAAGAVAMVLVLRVLDREHAPRPTHGLWEADWARRFPREYDSWRQDRGTAAVHSGQASGRTKWGGAGHRAGEPRAGESRALFAGYAFAVAADPLQVRHPVACQTCHDPETMILRLTQPAFLAALAGRGVDPGQLSSRDLGAYVCAQCHVAAFPQWKDRTVRIPFTAEGLVSLAERLEVTDWSHAVSGTPLLKVRHPEYELWALGVHAHKDVTCVDCHMPALREGSLRITSHRMLCPLLDVTSSCVPCHRWGEARLRERVEAIQDATMALQRRAAEALQAAHAAVGVARAARVPEARLDSARALIRQAQTRWDFIASDHSTGFHAPQAAAEQLAIAIDQARQADLLARRLTSKEVPGLP